MDQPDRSAKSRLICLCNCVSQDAIELAIQNGAHTLGEIFDQTLAGVGACGGSCQPILRKMLETYLATGEFPDDPRPPARKPKRRRGRHGSG